MRFEHSGASPVYSPNSKGGPVVTDDPFADHTWQSDGEFMRSAYTLRPDDDDFSQPNALINDVMDEAERGRLVDTVVSTLGTVTPEMRERVVEYWRNIDKSVGDAVNAQSNGR